MHQQHWGHPPKRENDASFFGSRQYPYSAQGTTNPAHSHARYTPPAAPSSGQYPPRGNYQPYRQPNAIPTPPSSSGSGSFLAHNRGQPGGSAAMLFSTPGGTNVSSLTTSPNSGNLRGASDVFHAAPVRKESGASASEIFGAAPVRKESGTSASELFGAAPVRKESGASASEVYGGGAPDSKNRADSNQLPAGWVELKDPASGRPYYYQKDTNVTTWERPLIPIKKEEVVDRPREGKSGGLEGRTSGTATGATATTSFFSSSAPKKVPGASDLFGAPPAEMNKPTMPVENKAMYAPSLGSRGSSTASDIFSSASFEKQHTQASSVPFDSIPKRREMENKDPSSFFANPPIAPKPVQKSSNASDLFSAPISETRKADSVPNKIMTGKKMEDKSAPVAVRSFFAPPPIPAKSEKPMQQSSNASNLFGSPPQKKETASDGHVVSSKPIEKKDVSSTSDRVTNITSHIHAEANETVISESDKNKETKNFFTHSHISTDAEPAKKITTASDKDEFSKSKVKSEMDGEAATFFAPSMKSPKQQIESTSKPIHSLDPPTSTPKPTRPPYTPKDSSSSISSASSTSSKPRFPKQRRPLGSKLALPLPPPKSSSFSATLKNKITTPPSSGNRTFKIPPPISVTPRRKRGSRASSAASTPLGAQSPATSIGEVLDVGKFTEMLVRKVGEEAVGRAEEKSETSWVMVEGDGKAKECEVLKSGVMEEHPPTPLPQLPSGWVELMDVSTNRPYYLNRDTNTTTWTRPSLGPIPEDAPSVTTPEKTEKVGSDISKEIEEIAVEKIDESNKDGCSPEQPVVQVTESPFATKSPMKEPEEEKLEDVSEKPTANPTADQIIPEPTSETSGEELKDKEEEQLLEIVEQSIKTSDNVQSPSKEITHDNLDSPSTAKEKAPLSPGWVELIDHSTGKPYYVQEKTNVTTWERPTVDDQEQLSNASVELKSLDDGANEGSSPVKKEEQPDEDVELHDDSSEGVDEPSTTEIAPKTVEDKAESAVIEKAPLPPGWVELIDSGCGRPYYLQQETNTTAWERPTVGDQNEISSPAAGTAPVEVKFFDNVAIEESSPAKEKEQPSKEKDSYGDEMEEFSGPSAEDLSLIEQESKSESAETEKSPLPSGWVELVDPGSGKPYYVQQETNTTTWKRPTVDKREVTLSSPAPVEVKSLDDGAKEEPSLTREEKHDDQIEEMGVPPAEAMSPIEPEAEPESAVAEKPSLPHGWVELVDPGSGKPYYFQQETNTTSWERPISVSHEDIPVSDSVGMKLLDQAIKEPSPVKKEERLPKEDKKLNNDRTEVVGVPPAEVLCPPESETEPESTVTEKYPLPPGWVELVDPGTGKPYYVQQETNTTTWERPTGDQKKEISAPATVFDDVKSLDAVSIEKPSLAIEEEPLLKVEKELLDDITEGMGVPPAEDLSRIEQETKPESAAIEKATLPPGWVELIDSDSGRPYYYQQETNTTSWERPADEDPATDSVDIKSLDQAVKEPSPAMEEERLPEEKKLHAEQTEVMGVPPAEDLSHIMGEAELESEVTEKAPLPPGWVELVDPGSGKPYYVQQETNTTTWERPVIHGEGEVSVTESVEVNSLDGDVIEKSSPSTVEERLPKEEKKLHAEQTKVMGVRPAEDLSPMMGEAEPESAVTEKAPLPPGWVELVDPGSGRPYYVQQETNTITWERPTVDHEEEISSPALAPAFNDVKSFDDTSIKEPSPAKNEELYDNGMEEVDVPATEALSHIEQEAKPESTVSEKDTLPPGWVELIDSDSSRPYYYQQETNTTSWERPIVDNHEELPAPEEPSGEAIAALNPEEIKESSPANEEKQLLNKEKTSSAEEAFHIEKEKDPESDLIGKTPLPPGWVELVDPDSGKPYYYQQETNTTSWERPTNDEAEVAVSSHAPVEVKSLDVGTVEESSSAQEEEKLLNKEKIPLFENASHIKKEESESTSTEKPPLPPGWVELIDSDSGRPYYMQQETNTVTWERPIIDDHEEVAVSATAPVEVKYLDDGTKEELSLSSAKEKEPSFKKEELHDEMKEFADPSAEALPHIEQDVKLESTESEKSPLPPGWVELIDPGSGRPYYVQKETEITTWERPICDDKEEANAPTSLLEEEVTALVDDGAKGEFQLEKSEEKKKEKINDNVEKSYDGNHAAEIVPESESSVGVAEKTPLPPGWVELIDPGSGRPYYVQQETKITTWERPVIDDQKEPAKPAATSEEAASSLNDDNGKRRPSLEEKEKHEMDVRKEVNSEAEGVNAPFIVDNKSQVEPEPSASDTEKVPLPSGWVELVDPGSGRPYYYQQETNSTTWERPVIVSDIAVTSSSASTSDDGVIKGDEKKIEQASLKEVKTTDITTAGAGDTSSAVLPPGWVKLFDSDSGKPYYYNELDNTTSWTLPSDPSASSKGSHSVREGMSDKNLSNVRGNLDEKVSSASLQRVRRPAHAIARFGFGGRLCVMFPRQGVRLGSFVNNQTTSYDPSTAPAPPMRKGPVVIHRLRHLVPSDRLSIANEDVTVLGGPLISAKEVDVLSHLEQKANRCNKGEESHMNDNADLLWKLINVAARSKGRLRSEEGARDPYGPEAAIVNLLLGEYENENDSSTSVTASNNVVSPEGLQRGDPSSSSLKLVQGLLLRGKREEAVTEALKEKHYALALLVGSMCDRKTYQRAARCFADEALLSGSPLHTVAMLFSGLLQVASDEKNGAISASSFWGTYENDLDQSWKYHLASILSNRTLGWDKLVLALGDHLMQQGNVHASHFCYMVCGCHITPPSRPSSRLVLLGCDHLTPLHASLMTSEGVESFERTEAFEWARRRGNPNAAIPALQPFKLQFAKLLADCGYEEQACKYVESIRVCTGVVGNKNSENSHDTKKSVTADAANANNLLSYPDSFIEALDVFEDRICVSLGTTPSWNKSDSQTRSRFSNPFKDLTKGMLSKLGPSNKADNKNNASIEKQAPDDALLEENSNEQLTDNQQHKGENTNIPVVPNSFDAIVESREHSHPSQLSQNPSQMEDINFKDEPHLEKSELQQKRDPQHQERNKSESSIVKEEDVGMGPGFKSAPPSLGKTNKVTFSDDKSTKEQAPGSERRSGLGAWLLKKINPNAVVADPGQKMEAYYDEKLKRWIFPGDDPAEVAKPLPPPPIIPKQDLSSPPAPPKAVPPTTNDDPLAALMAPPTRGPPSLYGDGNSMRSRYPTSLSGKDDKANAKTDTPLSAKLGPPLPGSTPAAVPPKFTVFQPKPSPPE